MDPSDGENVLLRVENLRKHFPIRKGIIFQKQTGAVQAVNDVSFVIKKGETLGLVGESGCGKSTTGRTIIQLQRPTSGSVYLEGVNLVEAHGKKLRQMRRKMQMIFQDPYASLNPRMTIGEIIGEPLIIYDVLPRNEIKEWVENLLELVGLNPSFANRYPHEFSGGQRQRVGVARALALHPSLVVCDEPVSALDVSIQAQIINLLCELQEKLSLAYLFIAHDLSMVQHISDRVAVMYLGRIMELADSNELYANPLHPYTHALMSAVPIPDPFIEKKRKRVILQGDVPSPVNPPSGCQFRTRCPLAQPICSMEQPAWREVSPGHFIGCHFAQA